MTTKIDTEQKSFFEMVAEKKGTEKHKFRERMLKATGAKNPTWYYWMQTRKIGTPSQILISNDLGISREILFPES